MDERKRSYPPSGKEDEDDSFLKATILLPNTVQEGENLENIHYQQQQLRKRNSIKSIPIRSQLSSWIKTTTTRMNATNAEYGRGRSVLHTKLEYYYFKFRNSVLFYILCLLILFGFIFVWNPFEYNESFSTASDGGGNSTLKLLEKDATQLTENDFESRSSMFHYEELVQRMINWMKSRDEQCSTIRHYRLNVTTVEDMNVVVVFTKNGGKDPIIMWNAEVEDTYGKIYVHAEYSDFINKKKNVSRAAGMITRYTEWQSPNDYNMNKKYRSKSPDEARCILHCIDVNSAGKHLNTFLYNTIKEKEIYSFFLLFLFIVFFFTKKMS